MKPSTSTFSIIAYIEDAFGFTAIEFFLRASTSIEILQIQIQWIKEVRIRILGYQLHLLSISYNAYVCGVLKHPCEWTLTYTNRIPIKSNTNQTESIIRTYQNDANRTNNVFSIEFAECFRKIWFVSRLLSRYFNWHVSHSLKFDRVLTRAKIFFKLIKLKTYIRNALDFIGLTFTVRVTLKYKWKRYYIRGGMLFISIFNLRFLTLQCLRTWRTKASFRVNCVLHATHSCEYRVQIEHNSCKTQVMNKMKRTNDVFGSEFGSLRRAWRVNLFFSEYFILDCSVWFWKRLFQYWLRSFIVASVIARIH